MHTGMKGSSTSTIFETAEVMCYWPLHRSIVLLFFLLFTGSALCAPGMEASPSVDDDPLPAAFEVFARALQRAEDAVRDSPAYGSDRERAAGYLHISRMLMKAVEQEMLQDPDYPFFRVMDLHIREGGDNLTSATCLRRYAAPRPTASMVSLAVLIGLRSSSTRASPGRVTAVPQDTWASSRSRWIKRGALPLICVHRETSTAPDSWKIRLTQLLSWFDRFMRIGRCRHRATCILTAWAWRGSCDYRRAVSRLPLACRRRRASWSSR